MVLGKDGLALGHIVRVTIPIGTPRVLRVHCLQGSNQGVIVLLKETNDTKLVQLTNRDIIPVSVGTNISISKHQKKNMDTQLLSNIFKELPLIVDIFPISMKGSILRSGRLGNVQFRKTVGKHYIQLIKAHYTYTCVQNYGVVSSAVAHAIVDDVQERSVCLAHLTISCHLLWSSRSFCISLCIQDKVCSAFYLASIHT